MMTVDIESGISDEPMASMHVRVVGLNFSITKDGRPYLTSDSTGYKSFCAQVDNRICSLESLKPKAKLKFAEFDRNK